MPISPTPRLALSGADGSVVALAALVVALGLMLPVALGGSGADRRHELRDVRRRQARQGEPEAEAGRHRPGQPAGRPGRRSGRSWTPAVETAVKYANDRLRGVGGHPIVLKKCFIKNAEEEGTRCGQLMANDKRVSVVLWGGVVIGNQSLLLGSRRQEAGRRRRPRPPDRREVQARRSASSAAARRCSARTRRSRRTRSRRRPPRSSTRRSRASPRTALRSSTP